MAQVCPRGVKKKEKYPPRNRVSDTFNAHSLIPAAIALLPQQISNASEEIRHFYVLLRTAVIRPDALFHSPTAKLTFNHKTGLDNLPKNRNKAPERK